eukprot:TRINITY_DN38_c0_g1_i2.p1 TRINITY_DN38_c0_g1~~TRINITY_DN38_c0_g1_i2.p1  ORF type:complete len:203 (+),score=40.37 TRINITY_DN38_c0_g1_i2:47-610(+)
MKNLTALFAAAALTLTAGLAQADVRPDQIPSLLQSGAVKPFEQLNAAALAKHAGATINSNTNMKGAKPELVRWIKTSVGSTGEHYYVFCHPGQAALWRKDKTIPLIDVLEVIEVFTKESGNTDYGRPGKDQLKAAFDTANQTEICTRILEEGEILGPSGHESTLPYSSGIHSKGGREVRGFGTTKLK